MSERKRGAGRLSIAGRLLIIWLVVLLLSGCGKGQQYKKVSLVPKGEGAAAPSSVVGKFPLRVAVAAVISPQATVQSYTLLMDYLGQKLGHPVQLVQRPTYIEINELLRSGVVDLAFICTGAYVEGLRDFQMELLVVPQVRGELVYYSYIIVPGDSPATSLEDLRGKTFAFTDPLSNSGTLAPTYMLHQMGETPQSFFGKHIFTYSHDKSIKAVADKLVDGAAVDSLVYDYMLSQDPQLGAKAKVIQRSPPYGIPPIVVNPKLEPGLKSQLREVFLTMDQEDRGREALRVLMIDRFVLADDRMYDSVRQMAYTLRSGP